MPPLFFYGTLRDPALLELVLGRPLKPGETRPARAPGHATRRLEDEAYPVLVPQEGAVAEGLLLAPPAPEEQERILFFEDEEYGLVPIEVESGNGPEQAVYFRPTEKPLQTHEPWDFHAWCERDREVALEAAAELMAMYGHVAPSCIDDAWAGIMLRARQRVRARQCSPPQGPLRRFPAPDDVETVELRRPFSGYLAVEERRLRYRRFDGGWLGPVPRTAVLWGDAVTVLPYDPRTDRVLLVEQFRPGPQARGDPNPWCIEVVAGRLDADEDAEDVARREALEEAGLRLGRLERIGLYYPTPGLAGECLTAFVGEADLAEAGGVHGLEAENEDIRSMTLSFAEAMQAATSGTVNTGPALVSLLWLAHERERLLALWG